MLEKQTVIANDQENEQTEKVNISPKKSKPKSEEAMESENCAPPNGELNSNETTEEKGPDKQVSLHKITHLICK